MRELEIRCLCSKAPLLAVGGRDEHGNPFVHLKVFKQSRVFGEMIATSGKVHLRCRECQRWLTIRIRNDVEVQPEELPAELRVS